MRQPRGIAGSPPADRVRQRGLAARGPGLGESHAAREDLTVRVDQRDEQAVVLMLAYCAGLTQVEIAARVGLPLGNREGARIEAGDRIGSAAGARAIQ